MAMLRAVNVGGTGALAMAELRRSCEAAGFAAVRTYNASGNVVFTSPLDAAAAKRRLEEALQESTGRQVRVAVRTADELAAALAANPFADAPPSTTVMVFLDAPPPTDTLEHALAPGGERLALGVREIYVAYGAGMGRSRLKLSAAAEGTARNVNTVAKLVAMAAEIAAA
ncbi:uncharacterized protein (DUF1697 family) [Sphingomonas sp. BK580]|nr:uncharacterized protein (DUF1697 family) [Sphingomonas sp. BK580]